MKAELKRILSIDIDHRSYWPEDVSLFGFTVDATIGPTCENGGDMFHFFVCSPRWIIENFQKNKIGDSVMFGKGLILLPEYDWQEVEKAIAQLCGKISGEGWNEIATKLSKFGNWEFDDYQFSNYITNSRPLS